MDYFFDRKYIRGRDMKYGILFDELINFELHDVEQAIQNIENVLSRKFSSSSINGAVMSSIEFDREKAIISYYDEVIGEEPTEEIYQMFQDYKDVLQNAIS